MQTQIKTMSEQGHSIRTIARVPRLSRRTVRKYLEPVAEPASGSGGWEENVDWEYVRQEVNGKGTTGKQIGREVAPEIEYVKFCQAFRERVGPQGAPVTIRLHHKPGEKTQVDFCDGLWITDPHSGEKTLTQFFLGVLPFSSYTFGEFVSDQKLPTFIGVQERMFAYFGGITPYLVVDNLKSGVKRADRYDPDVNPTYCALPTTWALPSYQRGRTSPGTRAPESLRSEWSKEISFKKSVTGFSIHSQNSTRGCASI